MFKNILVQVEIDEEGEHRLAIAVELARRFDAKLTGLTVVLPPSWGGGAGLPQLMADIEDANDAYFAASRELFNKAVGEAGLKGEFLFDVGNIRQILPQESAFADLVIAGEITGKSAEEVIFTADDAVVASSAPILVIPHGFAGAVEARTIVIAWRNTRAAARAVRDAIPLLRTAETVIVASVAQNDAEISAEHQEDLIAHLTRHGVRAEGEELPAHGAVGQTIIDLAKTRKADLIVAGGYGHAKLQEWLMGGVTETLLHHSPIPCFLSH